jgi:SHS2 domain-containing protein
MVPAFAPVKNRLGALNATCGLLATRRVDRLLLGSCLRKIMVTATTPLASHTFENHTGEVRLRVRAPSLEALFAEAARGLAELMGGGEVDPRSEPDRIEVRARNREALLVSFLNALIFRSETLERVYPEAHIEHLSADQLIATAKGCPLARQGRPVKAATYQGLVISEVAQGHAAGIVLDV